MNKLTYIKTSLPLAALFMLGGCVDDNYDLDNIDTTTELKAENLTVPVNLAPIELESMIDIDENDPDAAIKIVEIDGQRYYAVQKGGNFNATTTVDKVNAPASKAIEGTSATINATGLPDMGVGAESMTFGIPEMTTTFEYEVRNVDEAIRSIKRLDLEGSRQMDFTITLSAPELAGVTESVTVRNLVVTLPKGMEARCGQYTASNGRLEIAEVSGSASGIRIDIVVSAIDMAALYGNADGLTVTNRAFDFSGRVGLESGSLTATASAGAGTLPSSVTLNADYAMSAFTVEAFSGKIKYNVNMSRISPVDLTDLPDFLNNDQTDLILVNPQINLVISNPVSQYGLDCVSGLTITAERDNDSQSQVLEEFVIDHTQGVDATLLMAPNPNSNVFPAFANSKPVKFEGLSNILSGNGLPKRLQVELTSLEHENPTVEGEADHFMLGEQLDVVGTYTFFTTLSLANNSRIVYAKEESGWSDEDVSAIKITALTIKATANNELPFGATLTGWPVVLRNGVASIDRSIRASAELTSGNEPQPFTLTFETTDGSQLLIEQLDGIYFEADINDFNGDALQPEQTITITDLRATVSGTYTKEL